MTNSWNTEKVEKLWKNVVVGCKRSWSNVT